MFIDKALYVVKRWLLPVFLLAIATQSNASDSLFSTADNYSDFTNQLPQLGWQYFSASSGYSFNVDGALVDAAVNTPQYSGNQGIYIGGSSFTTSKINYLTRQNIVKTNLNAVSGEDASKSLACGANSLRVSTSADPTHKYLVSNLHQDLLIDWGLLTNGDNVAWYFAIWPTTQRSGEEYWIGLNADVVASGTMSGEACNTCLKIDATKLKSGAWNLINVYHPAVIYNGFVNLVPDEVDGFAGWLSYGSNLESSDYSVDCESLSKAVPASFPVTNITPKALLTRPLPLSNGTPETPVLVSASPSWIYKTVSPPPANNFAFFTELFVPQGGLTRPFFYPFSWTDPSITGKEYTAGIGLKLGGSGIILVNIGQGEGATKLEFEPEAVSLPASLVNLNITSIAPTRIRIAFSKTSAGTKLWVNGELLATNTSDLAKGNLMLSPATRLSIGYSRKNLASNGEGSVTRIATWNTAQSDADLLAVTRLPVDDGDSDHDGIPDAVEITYGLNPLDASDAGADFDNDGLSNTTEITAGTQLNNADSDGDGFKDGYEITNGLDPNATTVAGDVNGNDVLDVADLLLLQQYMIGERTLTIQQKAVCDIYPAGAPDGELSISDQLLIFRKFSSF